MRVGQEERVEVGATHWYIYIPYIDVFVLYIPSAATFEPVLFGQLSKDYLQRHVAPVLSRGLTELSKQKPENPVVSLCFHLYMSHSDCFSPHLLQEWLAHWLLQNNPNKPQLKHIES